MPRYSKEETEWMESFFPKAMKLIWSLPDNKSVKEKHERACKCVEDFSKPLNVSEVIDWMRFVKRNKVVHENEDTFKYWESICKKNDLHTDGKTPLKEYRKEQERKRKEKEKERKIRKNRREGKLKSEELLDKLGEV